MFENERDANVDNKTFPLMISVGFARYLIKHLQEGIDSVEKKREEDFFCDKDDCFFNEDDERVGRQTPKEKKRFDFGQMVPSFLKEKSAFDIAKTMVVYFLVFLGAITILSLILSAFEKQRPEGWSQPAQSSLRSPAPLSPFVPAQSTASFAPAQEQVQQPVQQPLAQTASSGPMPSDKRTEVVMGSGSKMLFVFSDPVCPFCKKLEPMLDRLSKNGYQVHIFPTAIHPESLSMVTALACADGDKLSVWKNEISNGIVPAKKTCDGSDDVDSRAIRFFTQFGFNATPTLVNTAGQVHVGAFDSYDDLVTFAGGQKKAD